MLAQGASESAPELFKVPVAERDCVDKDTPEMPQLGSAYTSEEKLQAEPLHCKCHACMLPHNSCRTYAMVMSAVRM